MFELSKQFDMLMFEEKKLVCTIFIKNHLQNNGIHDIFIDGKLIIGQFNSIDLIIKAEGSSLVLPSDVIKFIKTINEKHKEAYALLQDKETGSEVRKILMNSLPEIEQAAAKDIKSGSRFILKNLGRDVKRLIKTSNDKSNVETKLNKRKRENK
ncbi:hypothetical protein F8M41_019691 [Gigaspora margarita]|uniref:Uncharacterized protein n=1 Tax=Gigaspora margarita TaxID=4874 RepID=A0A8H4AJJ4_GIGMA|nr:hypothetical protein F8M41_019691 [Gigaspora margarita]